MMDTSDMNAKVDWLWTPAVICPELMQLALESFISCGFLWWFLTTAQSHQDSQIQTCMQANTSSRSTGTMSRRSTGALTQILPVSVKHLESMWLLNEPKSSILQRYHFWYLDIFILQTSIIISFFLWETPTDDLSLRSSPAGSATVWLRPLTRSRSLASMVTMSLLWSCLGRIPKKQRMGMVFPPWIFKGKLVNSLSVLGRFSPWKGHQM